jgi:hypothetical protein
LAKKILEERVGENFCSIFDFSTIYREKRAIKVDSGPILGPQIIYLSAPDHLSFDSTQREVLLLLGFA